MHAVVVFESMFGNTESIAEAVGKGLASHAEVDVVNVDDAPLTGRESTCSSSAVPPTRTGWADRSPGKTRCGIPMAASVRPPE